MSIVQWLLLFLVVVVVAGAYWYIRRAADSDPWQGMEESKPDADEDTASSGDSYIVGVRTINKETPADRKAAVDAARAREAAGADDAEPDRTRAVRQPTAVRRTRRVEPSTRTDDEPRPVSPTTVRSSEADPPPGLDETHREPPERAEPTISTESSDIADSTQDTEPDTELKIGSETTVETDTSRQAIIEPMSMVAPQPSAESQIFVLYVAASEGRYFEGPAIFEALDKADLKFGLNTMYHRVTEVHGVTESVFCVANMLNPGTLDPNEPEAIATRGLAMFLLVPGALEGRPAMRDMMETANLLATELGGQVLDDNRALLKAQTAQYMLDQIADLDRRAKLMRRR